MQEYLGDISEYLKVTLKYLDDTSEYPGDTLEYLNFSSICFLVSSVRVADTRF